MIGSDFIELSNASCASAGERSVPAEEGQRTTSESLPTRGPTERSKPLTRQASEVAWYPGNHGLTRLKPSLSRKPSSIGG